MYITCNINDNHTKKKERNMPIQLFLQNVLKNLFNTHHTLMHISWCQKWNKFDTEHIEHKTQTNTDISDWTFLRLQLVYCTWWMACYWLCTSELGSW